MRQNFLPIARIYVPFRDILKKFCSGAGVGGGG